MSLSFDRANLHQAYARGLDPKGVVATAFERLEAADDPGIFISLTRREAERALEGLGAFDPVAKPLWGLPFAVKDNIDLAGVATTAACPEFSHVAAATATAVARLLAAGAIPIGKTNLDQFATGLVGVRTPYPVPRNSFDPAIVPGGSSAGSAVAVARGIVCFALGTDTAGSGRIPAGLNNLVGLKPTIGAVPVRGVLPACQTLDCVSVFALTVGDAWQVFEAMAGFDPDDPWSRRLPRPELSRPPHPRVGVPDAASLRFFGDTAAEAAFARSLASLRGIGATLVEIDFEPFFAVARLLYEGPWVAERYAAIRAFIEARPEALHPTTLRVIGGARTLSAADAFAGLYRLAELERRTEATWAGLDLLAVPTVPRAYTRAELEADPLGPNSALGTYTNFVNLLDLCALSVPGPFRPDGFPGGLTLVAPANRDGMLAGLGADLQAAAGIPLGATGVAYPGAVAPIAAVDAAPASAEIELVVVGAHLAGLPLNRDLVALGARFVRQASTTGDYRLYALPGGPPRRPGLVRVGDRDGAEIAVEVWALSPASFGRFVADIPAPLGIGTIRLSDGTRPKGFLCEPAALTHAEDVTRFGGWRAFLRSVAA